jgi:hypothetical protein
MLQISSFFDLKKKNILIMKNYNIVENGVMVVLNMAAGW